MQLNLDGNGPLHRQVERAIREAVLAGRLAPGQRLPSTRDFATVLGVSRPVIQLAYQHLCVEGYARARVGSGTYIEDGLPERFLVTEDRTSASPRTGENPVVRLSKAGERLSELDLDSNVRIGGQPRRPLGVEFRYGAPTTDVQTLAIWRKVIRNAANRLDVHTLDVSDPAGWPALREAIAGHIRTHRAVRCEASQVVIVSGTQQALDLAVRLLIDPGQRAAIEDPHYVGARDVLQAAGAEILSVPVDSHGLDPSVLKASRRRVRLVFTTPSHQFPTGATMSAARRIDLLSWAADSGAIILEDDYDGEYRYDARLLPSIQGQDRADRVVYIGTFSKVLFPAMRLGFVVLPSPLLKPFLAAKWLADYQSPLLEQLALAQFLEDGHFDRHLRRTRRAHAARRDALRDAVTEHLGSEAVLLGDQAGDHVLLRFPDLEREGLTKLIERAGDRGVRVRSSAAYYLSVKPQSELVLGYGSLSVGAIRRGIEVLGEALIST